MDMHTAMQVFVRVVEAGNFSKAARQLNLAPTSISRQVVALEDKLGVRLLNRTTRRQRLTEAGLLYFDRVKQILNEIDTANLAVSTLEATPSGTLRVTAPITFGRLYIVPALNTFLERYPNLHVSLTLTDSVTDLVEEGYDVAVRIGELADSRLITRKLATTERIICASPAYLNRAGVPSHPRDLDSHNCLVFQTAADDAVWQFSDRGGAYNVRVRGDFSTNSADAIRTAALEGLGLARVPTWLVARDIRRGALNAVLTDDNSTLEPLSIHALYAHNRHLSPKVRAFVDFLVERFAASPNLTREQEPESRERA
jgi:DNA-binding transcriptional LysR family regulator